MKRVEFIKYTGRYPSLCSGKLYLRINGEDIDPENFGLWSGGSCNWRNDSVEKGEWRVIINSNAYEPYREEITAVVNANVPYGCCGGCN